MVYVQLICLEQVPGRAAGMLRADRKTEGGRKVGLEVIAACLALGLSAAGRNYNVQDLLY